MLLNADFFLYFHCKTARNFLYNLTYILKVITYLSGVSNIDINSSHVRAYDPCDYFNL